MKHSITIIFIAALIFSACKKKSDPSTGKTEVNITPSDYLTDAKFKSMMVDFLYDEGFPPTTDAVNNLKAFLTQRLNKPGGVQMIVKAINSSGKSSLSIDDVSAIEKKNRSYYSDGSILGVFVYYTNAEYSGNGSGPKVLGINYNPTSIVLFGKSISGFTHVLGKPTFATIETSVAQHEFGHALGLVGKGTPMINSHGDGSHQGYCTNDQCLMHHNVETTDITSNLSSGFVPQLDADCLYDLKHNGGK